MESFEEFFICSHDQLVAGARKDGLGALVSKDSETRQLGDYCPIPVRDES